MRINQSYLIVAIFQVFNSALGKLCEGIGILPKQIVYTTAKDFD
jgi:hypothetical protein